MGGFYAYNSFNCFECIMKYCDLTNYYFYKKKKKEGEEEGKNNNKLYTKLIHKVARNIIFDKNN